MDRSATRFEVHVNGKRIATATVSIPDQIEINLVSLAGNNDAVLTVTAFLPGAPIRGHYVHTRNLTVSPGDTVTIGLEEAQIASTTVIEAVTADPGEDPHPGSVLKCSFCGKSQHEVRKVVAGQDVIICDECISLCHDIVSNET